MMNISQPCSIKSTVAITDNFTMAVGSSIAEVDLEFNSKAFSCIPINRQEAPIFLEGIVIPALYMAIMQQRSMLQT